MFDVHIRRQSVLVTTYVTAAVLLERPSLFHDPLGAFSILKTPALFRRKMMMMMARLYLRWFL